MSLVPEGGSPIVWESGSVCVFIPVGGLPILEGHGSLAQALGANDLSCPAQPRLMRPLQRCPAEGPLTPVGSSFPDRPMRRGLWGGPSLLLGLSASLCQGVQNRQRGNAQIGAVCCGQHPPFSSAGGPPPSDTIPLPHQRLQQK